MGIRFGSKFANKQSLMAQAQKKIQRMPVGMSGNVQANYLETVRIPQGSKSPVGSEERAGKKVFKESSVLSKTASPESMA